MENYSFWEEDLLGMPFLLYVKFAFTYFNCGVGYIFVMGHTPKTDSHC